MLRHKLRAKSPSKAPSLKNFQWLKKNLGDAVKLLKEVSQGESAFGKPLERATLAIDTLNKAIENLAAKYKGNGTNPTGGYKAAGPRYGGAKKVDYKPPVY